MISFSLFSLVAKAADFTVNNSIPGTVDVAQNGPAGFVSNFYEFALLIAGVLAFGAIVFGGFLYATSAGNPSRQSDGRSWITSALIGLLLLAGAWIILNTVNPNLTALTLPALSQVDVRTTVYGNGDSQGACSGVTCPPGTLPVNSQTNSTGGASCSCQNSTGRVFCGGQDYAACPTDASGRAQTCTQISQNPIAYGCRPASNSLCGVPDETRPGDCPQGQQCVYGYRGSNGNPRYFCSTQ